MKRIGFILLDGYALMSTASALEPLRAANQFASQPVYEITLLSERGGMVHSSLGAGFDSRSYHDITPVFDLVFVVAGGQPEKISLPTLFAWLRQADRNGVALGGISGGAVILAKAGLLENRRFTVHWHHYGSFEKSDGNWLLEKRLFIIDRDRYTCAGGSAPLDMMHALIAREHGRTFAQRISDWFIQTEIRHADAPQKTSIPSRYGALPEPVEAALTLMGTHIADPLSQDQIAELVGLSSRQLQRLFANSVGQSTMQEYRAIRLSKGRDLLENTHIPLSDISEITGFSSQAHFTSAFRAAYGQTPAGVRRQTKTGPRTAGP